MELKLPSKSVVKSLLNNGLVSDSTNTKSISPFVIKLGEFFDVLSVAYGLKPLAALDFTPYGKKKLKKLDIKLINKVIEFCNKQGVKYIHHTKTGGMYLKSVFFLPENYQKAVNLMFILWKEPKLSDEPIIDNMYHHFYIGRSLGYSDKNIQFFLKKNLDVTLTETQLKKINKQMDKDKYTIDDMNPLKIKVIETIKPL